MAARRTSLRIGLALLLGCGALGCGRQPVVFDIDPGAAGVPGNAGAGMGMGGAGMAGLEPMAGSGVAGSAAPQTCALPYWYAGARMLLDAGCRVRIETVWLRQLIERYLDMYVVAPPGESRGIDFCDPEEDRLWFVPDPNDPEFLKLCDSRCTLLMEQVGIEDRKYADCMAKMVSP